MEQHGLAVGASALPRDEPEDEAALTSGPRIEEHVHSLQRLRLGQTMEIYLAVGYHPVQGSSDTAAYPSPGSASSRWSGSLGSSARLPARKPTQ